MGVSSALAVVSGIALGVACLSMLGLHLFEAQFNPIRDAISLYVYARTGVLYNVDAIARGFCALGLVAALAAGGDRLPWPGLLALGMYGLARLTIPAFPGDRRPPLTRRGARGAGVRRLRRHRAGDRDPDGVPGGVSGVERVERGAVGSSARHDWLRRCRFVAPRCARYPQGAWARRAGHICGHGGMARVRHPRTLPLIPVGHVCRESAMRQRRGRYRGLDVQRW